MYIIATAWVYVVFMMSITETSFIAGLMTFLFYCVVPLSIVLYLMRSMRGKPGNRPAPQQNQPDSPAQSSALPPAESE